MLRGFLLKQEFGRDDRRQRSQFCSVIGRHCRLTSTLGSSAEWCAWRSVGRRAAGKLENMHARKKLPITHTHSHSAGRASIHHPRSEDTMNTKFFSGLFFLGELRIGCSFPSNRNPLRSFYYLLSIPSRSLREVNSIHALPPPPPPLYRLRNYQGKTSFSYS
jgi:hypothetical protein